MALTDQTLSLIAFKTLLGKSQTDNNKGLGNEAEGIFLNVASNDVYLDNIDSDPSVAVSNGTVVLVEANLVLDPTSNGHGYFAEYPAILPAGLPSGTLTGDRVKISVSPSYGFQYEAKPFSGASPIPVNDGREWVYQYNSGIFFQEGTGSTPTTINIYVYVGKKLSDIDFDNLATSGVSSEWQDSVDSKVNDSSVLTPVIGDRYLIIDESTCGAGADTCLLNDFVGQSNNIVEWGGAGTGWEYTIPTDGMTVKIDIEDGYAYHYEDTVTTVGWTKYSYGQTRVLHAVGTNDYTGTINPPIDAYRDDLILLTIFANDNTSTGTVNIDGLGVKDIVKSVNGVLVPLDAGDIQQGIIYFMVYDGVQFQLSLGGGGNGIIGSAEDGDYTDGLFTDFVDTTPVGTAVDRFNEVLKALAPPPAPDLSDWSGDTSTDIPSGKLSFDTSNPIGGYISAELAPSNPISADGSWSNSGKRLGIKPVTGNITGVLNDQVLVGPGDPTPAYATDSFGDGEKGTLTLSINGSVVNSIDLTSTTATITDTASSGSILSVTAQETSKFPSGASLDLFIYRTGTYNVVSSDTNLVNGYNYIIVEHNTGSVVKTLDRYEFVIDDDTTDTSFSSETFSGLAMTGSKKLSGIDYNTGGTVGYNLTIGNAYRNTYSASASAVSHTGALVSSPSEPLLAQSGDESALVVLTSKTATLTPSGVRILNDSISLSTSVDRTVQTNLTSTGASIGGILMDNVNASSTLLSEGFDDETSRLVSNLSYDLVSHISNGKWLPEQSIADGAIGHTTGLQVIGSKLIYPGNIGSLPTDFRTSNITNGSIFNDGGVGGTGRDYSTLTGTRTYYRYFEDSSQTTGNFIINVAGSGGTFVGLGTSLAATNNIHLEMKAPTQTGWMDCYEDFVTNQTSDSDGSRASNAGVGRAFGAPWGLTMGVKSTAQSGDSIVVRITVDASFTGEFTSISFGFN